VAPGGWSDRLAVMLVTDAASTALGTTDPRSWSVSDWVSDLAPLVYKDHGSSVKNDKQYEGLRKKGMSKSRAAAISNSEGASSRGGKKSGSGGSSKSNCSQGGTSQQKKAAGRKGGKATANKS
jgi:hypothetical protein